MALADMALAQRKTIPGFIQRTRNNLSVIRSQPEKIAHPVTQLVCSMLGLVVFPWEGSKKGRAESTDPVSTYCHKFADFAEFSLDKLEEAGWPHWSVMLDQPPQNAKTRKNWKETTTLGTLVSHLRNALSHYRIDFSCDSSDLSKVFITFDDRPFKEKEPNWRATMRADNLLIFSEKFAERALELWDRVCG